MRQSQIFEREGIDLGRSTLADWVGQSSKLLEPLAEAIGRYACSCKAVFADDTPIKMQAKKKCATARIWTYVRDERPWASDDLKWSLKFGQVTKVYPIDLKGYE
ncbi:transposase, partial [uncultured Roseibium sp.]